MTLICWLCNHEIKNDQEKIKLENGELAHANCDLDVFLRACKTLKLPRESPVITANRLAEFSTIELIKKMS